MSTRDPKRYEVMSASRRMLKLLSNVGETFSLNELLSKTGLSPSTLRKYVRELVKLGYIVKNNDKYTVSEKAKLLLEGERLRCKTVAENSAYIFTDEKNLPLLLKIDTIEKLYIAIKYRFVPPEIVMEHIAKGYLARWLIEVLGASMLAKQISNSKSIEEVISILEEYIGY